MPKETAYLFLYVGKQPPCFSCTVETGRSPVCHGACEKYKKYKEEYNKKASKLYIKRKMELLR